MTELTNGGRERSLQALRASEELHRVVLSNISDAVLLTDDDGRFTFICPNVDVLFGYSPDEVQRMERIDRLLGENLFSPAELDAAGEIRNLEREVSAKSGERKSVLVHAKRVSIMGGTVLFACRDITERRNAEREMRAARQNLAHASRLAVLGQLVASIAHEISQPLTSVLANAGAALRVLSDLKKEDEQARMLREIMSDIHLQSHLAADVIDRLRRLTRNRPLEMKPLDVNDVLAELLRLVTGEARLRGITLQSDFGPALVKIYADRVCLQQVVLNLLMNAMDAVDEVARERQVTLRTRQLADAVDISVSDTGPGVRADVLPRLFDAFYTTKKEGVGLGLAIARNLVEAQGGQISLGDPGSDGTTFRVTLPVHGVINV